MAARLSTRQADTCRSAIQTTKILKRLQTHVMGDCEMAQTQVQAARILLDKSLPNLAHTEVTGEGGGPLAITIKQYGHRAA